MFVCGYGVAATVRCVGVDLESRAVFDVDTTYLST